MKNAGNRSFLLNVPPRTACSELRRHPNLYGRGQVLGMPGEY